MIISFVDNKRVLMPKIGTRKILHLIKKELPEEFHIGRDAFFDLLRDNHRLIRRKRTHVKTTDSNHWLYKYPNLIRNFIASKPNQLWVSDITYIRTKQGFMYLFLITDAYSRKIIGWSLGDTLEAKHAVNALKMALRQLPDSHGELVHHSDRGIQYCSSVYVKLLQKKHIKISMTENGDPLENAIAERVNGILKEEWINDMIINGLKDAERKINKVIITYNSARPHSSLNNMTPEMAHNQSGELKRLWRNYYKKREPEMYNFEEL